jgi:hypothetical protein
MGSSFEVYLEYDGKNPDRNDFICRLNDDCCFPYVKRWDGLYDNDLLVSCRKKHSLEVEKDLKNTEFSWTRKSWGLNNIFSKIKSIKKEYGLNEVLEYSDDDDEFDHELEDIVCDLQWLYDLSMEKCVELKLKPEKCYVVWWIDY